MAEVKIGILDSPKELALDLDVGAEEIVKTINDALDAQAGLLWLTDNKGKKVGVPVAKIAYVEIEAEREFRSAGFAAG